MRVDVLIKNNTDYLIDWDTLWDGKTRIVSDGWTAEFAIPFRSISYDASRSDWGFDLSRFIRRKNERIRWSSISATIPSVDISRSGTLAGIHDLEQGVGLDVQVYGSVRYKREWQNPTDDDIKLVGSGNAYYRITPALTGTLTINPDFSDTPLDDRRINTSRFALFLPETRDFFLQDAGSFEFGGWGFRERSEWPGVLFAQCRPGQRRAGADHRRRQAVRRIWRLQYRRLHRLDRVDQHDRSSAAFGGADHAPGAVRIQDRIHRHQWRSHRRHARHDRGRRFPVSQFPGVRRRRAAGRRRLSAQLQRCLRRRQPDLGRDQLSQRAVGRAASLQTDRREFLSRAGLREPAGHPQLPPGNSTIGRASRILFPLDRNRHGQRYGDRTRRRAAIDGHGRLDRRHDVRPGRFRFSLCARAI